MRLIDADALLVEICEIRCGCTPDMCEYEYDHSKYCEAAQYIENAPTMATFHVIDKRTGKEADPYEIALKEDWAKDLCYCDMEGFAIEEDGTLLLLDECGRHESCDPDRFEVVLDAAD